MNTYTLTQRRITARFYAVVTIFSLLLTAFPAGFFVAEAARTGVTLTALGSVTVQLNEGARLQAQVQDDGDSTDTAVVKLTDNAGGGIFTNANSNNCSSDLGAEPQSLTVSSNSSNKNFCYKNATPGLHTITAELYVNDQKIGDSDTIQVTVMEPKPEDRNIDICHWNGHSYVMQSPNVNSIGNGHGNSGVNQGDIIPPVPGVFPNGFNWDWGQSWHGNKCQDPNPVPPVVYGDYCGDGVVNQDWEECDSGYLLDGYDDKKVGCSVQCQFITAPTCTDLTLAKVDIEKVSNKAGGSGDMTDDIYLGGTTPIPNGAWFMLYWNGVYADDADIAGYEDVPGLAVERDAGELRSVMYGSKTGADEEHVDGSIELWSWDGSVEAVDLRSDNSNDNPGNNKLEKDPDTNGGDILLEETKGNAGNDEVWLDSGDAHFWLTTTTADDGFYTEYSDPVVCELPPLPVCPNGDNLLDNGSFEKEVVTNSSKWQKFASVTGWLIEKVSDNSATTLELHKDWSSNEAAAGLQYAELDGDHSTVISQSVVTIPGAAYELRWAFAPRHGIAAEQNQLSVMIDGTEVAVEGPATSPAGLAAGDWTRSSRGFVADDTSVDIGFADKGPSNSYGTFLDDAVLCLVREPEPIVNLHTSKIVCDDEADLPNGDIAKPITASTASDWVNSHKSCSLVDGWEFEWAPKGTADPGDTLVGTAGGDWTTFTGSTEVPVSAFKGDGYFWMREVLQADYIPFTHEAHSDNSDNVTAEMYCHTDVKNFDNFDRVDGPVENGDYYCVAWNVPVADPDQCTVEAVSDTGTVVVENNEYALATYVHKNWTASIPGATWIWPTYYVENPDTDETYTFEETFTATNITDAALYVAADNGYKVYLNGVLVVDRSAIGNNFQSHTQKEFDVTEDLVPGANTMRIEVTNNGTNGSNAMSNPAGLLYKLIVNAETGCELTTETIPEEPTSYRLDGYKYEVEGEGSVPKADWTIYATNGDEILSTSTDETGEFYFDVPMGDWVVYESIPQNWIQTQVQQNGSIVDTDQDAERCEFAVYPVQYKANPVYHCEFFNEYVEPTEPVLGCTDDSALNYNPEATEGNEDANLCEFEEITTRSSNSSGGRPRVKPTPLVLGASTDFCPFLVDYMQMGVQNDPMEVMKLQSFLNIFVGPNPVTGLFGEITDANVKLFQEKYRSEILDPWYAEGIVPHSRPTGFVYKTTLWKINSIVCPDYAKVPVLEGEDLTTNVDLDLPGIAD